MKLVYEGDGNIVSILFCTVPATLLVSSGGQVEARVGSEVSLNCTASGYPPPVFTWWKNGEFLNVSDTGYSQNNTEPLHLLPTITEVESVLTIRDLVAADEGRYTCRAQSPGTNATELDPAYQLGVIVPTPGRVEF